MVRFPSRWIGLLAAVFSIMGCGLWELLFPPASDSVPPVPGGSGTILTGTVTGSSVQLLWSAATDDETAAASLRYLVVYSTADTIGTAAQALESGEALGEWTAAMTTVTVTGLSPETQYYFNVLVRDEADNTAAYNRTAATTEAVEPSADTVPPVPGGSGTIVTGTMTESSVHLSWTAATDDETATASLRYLAVHSTTDTIGTAAQALENGEAFGDWTAAMTTVTVTGLSPETLYYFNVLVRDEADNTAAYNGTAATTLAVEPSAEEIAAAAVLVMTSTWDATAHLSGSGAKPAAGVSVDASDLEFPVGGTVIVEFTAYAPPGTNITISGTITAEVAWRFGSEPEWIDFRWTGAVTLAGLGVQTCTVDVTIQAELGDWSTATWSGTITAHGVETDLDAVMAEYIAHIIASTSDTGDGAAETIMARWARTVTAGSNSSVYRSVAADSAGNVYTAGYQSAGGTYTYGPGVSAAGPSGFANVVLVKYDAAGAAQWARTVIGGSGGSVFNSVALDSTGNVYAAGHQNGSGMYTYGDGVSAAGSSGNKNVVLVKYDAAGTAQWARTVGNGSHGSEFNSIAVDSTGNVYVAGYQVGDEAYIYGPEVSAAGSSSTGSNVVLVKYDAAGTAQWARTVSHEETVEDYGSQYYSVAADPAGSVYAAGYQSGCGTFTYGPGVSATSPCSSAASEDNVVLVKYDAAGTAQWARTVSSGSHSSAFNSVAVDSTGNVYAAGYQGGDEAYTYGLGVSAAGSSSWDSNVVLVKYDAAGTAQWARTVSSGLEGSRFNSVAVDLEGSVYAAGYQYDEGTYTYAPGISVAGWSPSENVVLVRYDAAGAAQWARTVGRGIDGSVFGSVTVDSTESVYAAGHQKGSGAYIYGFGVSAAGSSPSSNVVLVKYTP